MDRRHFLKKGATAAALSAIGFTSFRGLATTAQSSVINTNNHALVAVMGDSPQEMLKKAIDALGGISTFVKPGQKIVIKPNIGWAKTPEMGANTNPQVIGTLVKLCHDAGAKEILVFDHTCNEWESCYEMSGIKEEVEANGGKMVPGNNETYYKDVELPLGLKINSTKIHEAILECDAWFNVPTLKHHGGAKMSLSMKNSMGIVWDRRSFHLKALQQCIADLATFEKKPILNIIDGYRTLSQNGPQGKSIDDVILTKTLFASVDPVAIDTAAVKFFNQIKEMPLEKVSHIALAEEHQLGTSDLTKVTIKRFKL